MAGDGGWGGGRRQGGGGGGGLRELSFGFWNKDQWIKSKRKNPTS